MTTTTTSSSNDKVQIQVLFFASAREAAGNVLSADLTLEAETANTAFLRYVLLLVLFFSENTTTV